MITRIDYSSDDGSRHAQCDIFDANDMARGHVWSVDLKNDCWRDVAEWRRLPTREVAEEICRRWAERGEIAEEPRPSWRRPDARSEMAS